jgi:hypothetical protein
MSSGIGAALRNTDARQSYRARSAPTKGWPNRGTGAFRSITVPAFCISGWVGVWLHKILVAQRWRIDGSDEGWIVTVIICLSLVK